MMTKKHSPARRYSLLSIAVAATIAMSSSHTFAQGTQADSATTASAAASAATGRAAASAAAGAAPRIALRDSTPDGLFEVKLLGTSIVHGLTAPTRWTGESVRSAARAGALIVALSVLDDSGRDFMTRNQSRHAEKFATAVESLGTVENYAVLGGFLAAGIVFDDRKARAVAVEGIASSAVAAGVVTPTLQFLAGRSRPREKREPYTFDPFSGALSFPSGHTTQAFAVASVIATEYEQPWVKAAAYGGAGLVGLARMYHGGHFISDVATAAFIGTAVGRSVVGHGRKARGHTIEPAVIDGSAGVMLRMRTH